MLAVLVFELRHLSELILKELGLDTWHDVKHLRANDELIIWAESKVLAHNEVRQQLLCLVLNLQYRCLLVELLRLVKFVDLLEGALSVRVEIKRVNLGCGILKSGIVLKLRQNFRVHRHFFLTDQAFHSMNLYLNF